MMSIGVAVFVPRSRLKDLSFPDLCALYKYEAISPSSELFGGIFEDYDVVDVQRVLARLLDRIDDFYSHFEGDIYDSYCYNEETDEIDDICLRVLIDEIVALRRLYEALSAVDAVMVTDSSSHIDEYSSDPSYVDLYDLIDLAEKSWRSLK